MAQLPAYVCFLQDGYQESVSYDVRQVAMDNGLKKQRPGRSVALRTRKGAFRLRNRNELLQFQQWLKTIGNGTGSFDFFDPVQQQPLRGRFVNTEWLFSRDGKAWIVDVELETIDA